MLSQPIDQISDLHPATFQQIKFLDDIFVSHCFICLIFIFLEQNKEILIIHVAKQDWVIPREIRGERVGICIADEDLVWD